MTVKMLLVIILMIVTFFGIAYAVDYITPGEGTDDNSVDVDEIDWTYDWVYLDKVHGWGRALSDSIYLSSPIHDGNSSFLALDYAGDITVGDIDTFMVSTHVVFDCTIDSLQICYKESGSGKIDSIAFCGPDISNNANMTDSVYWGSGTDQTGASWTIAEYGFSSDISASAGDRFAVAITDYFGADNDSIFIGWIRMRILR